MKLRYVAFRGLMNLPGYSSIEDVRAFDAARPQTPRAFDLDFDEELRLIRITVPEQRLRNGLGSWIHPESKMPNFGLGRVCYVPLEMVARFELERDAEADLAPPPVKKPAPLARAAPPQG